MQIPEPQTTHLITPHHSSLTMPHCLYGKV
jgi:hypothetical protein